MKNINGVWVDGAETGVTGVWVARYDAAAHKMALYCPGRHPQYYEIGKV